MRSVLLSVVLVFAAGFAYIANNLYVNHLLIVNQEKIAEGAVKGIPLLQQFRERFSEEHHFISYVTGREAPTTWNSKAGLFGRYVVDMKVPARVDRRTFQLSLTGDPKVHVREVVMISPLPDGRHSIHYGAGFEIPSARWRDFLDKKVNLDELGIPWIKDRPVEGFDPAGVAHY